MISGISGLSSMMSGMRADPQQMFNRVDKDGNAGIDTDELGALTEKLGELTGTSIDAESIMAEFDGDGDGVLTQEEMKGAMESFKDQMGRPPMGGPMANGSLPNTNDYDFYSRGGDESQSLVDQLLASLSESDEEESQQSLTQEWLQTLKGENPSYSAVDLLF
ncbi:MAG: EF-hand domain-containing protein [Desulfosarcinaceae bacterium]|nr:EF-hand domain-containing protein [Desulfosarcinaceae bacterium]